MLRFASVISLLASIVAAGDRWSSTQIYSPDAAVGDSGALFTSTAHGLDAPKVTPVNATSYDWWYFDAVSEDQQYNVVFTFLAAPASGFPSSAAPDNAILQAAFFLSYPGHETSYYTAIPATDATVVSVGNGANGHFEGTGMGFTGTPHMDYYVVYLDSPSIGVKGYMTLQSLAPAHYPCGPAEAGQDMTIMPGVGWANAVPDAAATVELDVNGTSVNFSGVGYHDKNWGITPFQNNVGSWYWGHGRLGPYSIVWYDALTPTGAEYVSGYVACDGKILGAVCSNVSVRPTGANATYPPVIGVGSPQGFHIEIDLGAEGTMVLDAAATFHNVDQGGSYYRSTGTLTGGIRGQQAFNGTALWEEFALLPPA
ncbi:hypothetical protein MMC13_002514 [Lambiella insularis]|nr:hypothetical protein [Lambiella insularis]